MPTEVTDSALLEQLNAPTGKEVTDPGVLAQLNNVTGPAGENPQYHQNVQTTPVGSFIPGDVFSGRGLPGGTPAHKAMDLGGALAAGAAGPIAGAARAALGGAPVMSAAPELAEAVMPAGTDPVTSALINGLRGKGAAVISETAEPQWAGAQAMLNALKSGAKHVASDWPWIAKLTIGEEVARHLMGEAK